MEEGEAAEPAGRAEDAVAAAGRLASAGWWGIGQGDRAALLPLVMAGLTVGVNLDYRRLGLHLFLVLGETRGKESLWDLGGDGSFAARSNYSSSLGDVLVAAPPVDRESYESFWESRRQGGALDSVRVWPLEGFAFLDAPLPCFNEERRGFDFAWDDLPHRVPAGRRWHGGPVPPSGPLLRVLNEAARNPLAKDLDEVLRGAGASRADCDQALQYVDGYPLGWRFGGPAKGQSGLLLLYHSLSEESFGAVRGAISRVPYAVLEAWGKDPEGFVYFAEMVVPGEALAETTEYVGRVSAPCKGGFSSGFYEASRLQSFPLSRRAAQGDGRPL